MKTPYPQVEEIEEKWRNRLDENWIAQNMTNELGIKSQSNKLNDQYNATYTTDRNNIMLWHERLGYATVNIIKRMVWENLVQNWIITRKRILVRVLHPAKNTRAMHRKLVKIRSKEILDLVHSDIWGLLLLHLEMDIDTCLHSDNYSRRAFYYLLH